jgi:hypothetical protein
MANFRTRPSSRKLWMRRLSRLRRDRLMHGCWPHRPLTEMPSTSAAASFSRASLAFASIEKDLRRATIACSTSFRRDGAAKPPATHSAPCGVPPAVKTVAISLSAKRVDAALMLACELWSMSWRGKINTFRDRFSKKWHNKKDFAVGYQVFTATGTGTPRSTHGLSTHYVHSTRCYRRWADLRCTRWKNFERMLKKS